jgi:hypothetical protein
MPISRNRTLPSIRIMWMAARSADPNFDDSGWLVIQAGRPLSSYGLKNVDRVWYRTHVFIPANTHNLELLLSRFYGSEAVFVNGVQVQTSGAFRPGGVNQVYQPIKIPIPDAVLGWAHRRR